MRIRRISNAFEEIFADFNDMETDFVIFSNLFFQCWRGATKISNGSNWVKSATLFLNLNLKMLTSTHWTPYPQTKEMASRIMLSSL